MTAAVRLNSAPVATHGDFRHRRHNKRQRPAERTGGLLRGNGMLYDLAAIDWMVLAGGLLCAVLAGRLILKAVGRK